MSLGFGRLVIAAAVLLVIGLFCLVWAIPYFDNRLKSQCKTDFCSTRAAYWCVACSLVILALVTVAALIEHVALTLRR